MAQSVEPGPSSTPSELKSGLKKSKILLLLIVFPLLSPPELLEE
jgi:hypothetical protein